MFVHHVVCLCIALQILPREWIDNYLFVAAKLEYIMALSNIKPFNVKHSETCASISNVALKVHLQRLKCKFLITVSV